MIQDILKEIEDVDILVTSSVWNEEGKEPRIFDCSIELTYREPETGDLYSYMALPLDTCKMQVEKNKLYDARKDEDLCSEVEFEDDKIVGFLQWRRATYAERMTFIRKYNESKNLVCNIAEFLNIPACLAPCQELWDRLYENPMTIHFPDYADKALLDLYDEEEKHIPTLQQIMDAGNCVNESLDFYPKE